MFIILALFLFENKSIVLDGRVIFYIRAIVFKNMDVVEEKAIFPLIAMNLIVKKRV